MENDVITSHLMSQVASEILRPFQEPVKAIYIDSDFLYDYRLGALLLKSDTQKEYDYIRENIHAYENGGSAKITKYFPELKVTEQMLDDLERDLEWNVFVQAAAPQTQLLKNFAAFIAKVNTYNHSRDESQSLRIVINQRRHKMTYRIWIDLVKYFFSIDKDLVISRTNYTDWYSISKEEISQFDILFVKDLVDFTRIGSSSQEMLKDNLMNNKVVISHKQTEADFDDPKKEEESLENFANLMRLMLKEFSFIKRSIAKVD